MQTLCLTSTGTHTHLVREDDVRTRCGAVVSQAFPITDARPTCTVCAGGYLVLTYDTRR